MKQSVRTLVTGRELLVEICFRLLSNSVYSAQNKMSSPTAVQPPPPVKPPPTPPSVAASAGKGVSSKIYNGIIGYADKYVPAKLRPLWVHPAGGRLFICDISLLLLLLLLINVQYSFRTKDDFLLGTRCEMGKLF